LRRVNPHLFAMMKDDAFGEPGLLVSEFGPPGEAMTGSDPLRGESHAIFLPRPVADLGELVNRLEQKRLDVAWAWLHGELLDIRHEVYGLAQRRVEPDLLSSLTFSIQNSVGKM
jgi:hypothetical protein